MRTLGQYTRKARSMAAEFQNQFQEAMREAEMADLKKQVDDMASDIKNYDPLKDVRSDFDSMGKDIEKSLSSSADAKPAEPPPELAAEQPPVALIPDTQSATALPQPDATANPDDTAPAVADPAVAAPEPAAPEARAETAVAAPDPVAPEGAAEPAAPVAEPAATERS